MFLFCIVLFFRDIFINSLFKYTENFIIIRDLGNFLNKKRQLTHTDTYAAQSIAVKSVRYKQCVNSIRCGCIWFFCRHLQLMACGIIKLSSLERQQKKRFSSILSHSHNTNVSVFTFKHVHVYGYEFDHKTFNCMCLPKSKLFLCGRIMISWISMLNLSQELTLCSNFKIREKWENVLFSSLVFVRFFSSLLTHFVKMVYVCVCVYFTYTKWLSAYIRLPYKYV